MNNLLPLLVDYLPGILQTLTSALVVWAWWSLKRVFASHKDVQQLKTEIDERFTTAHTRMGKLESGQKDSLVAQEQLKQKLDLLPTAANVQELMLSMKGIEGDIKGINSKLGGLEHVTSRLERFVDMFTEASLEQKR